ncbi:NAD-dependent epimerase/dehydratase family protein [Gramella sp. AN32]|uniref:NAD-dependent epimerase/dehydratase family protein n=1 Tax=Christiangramia antarctica TaxID=2058158 RepID=A0ABW5X7M4_9FLAO|nr:NAD-dependent epimerase/dehydratase family protein [Gramella sp. AN32]MCM4155406.1 NAD-dependent epimerase [Gramella sp. AN32]
MILVTGGTGLVGSHLLLKLIQQEENVRALKRASSDLSKVKQVFKYYLTDGQAEELFKKIEWFEADILNIPQLTLAFIGITKVYHCAAHISFDPSDEKKLRKVNIEGTANIVNFCIQKNIKKICHVSSIAALGENPGNLVIDENAKWNPEGHHNDYAISKYGAEIEVWRATQEGLQAIIVNPGVIIGPGFWDDGSGTIFRRIDQGLKYHFPKITGFVGVNDVVAGMISLMNSEIKNENFVLISENLSFKTIFDLTAESLQKKKPKQELQKWMISMGWIFQKIGSWFGGKRQITRESIYGLFKEERYSSVKIEDQLNFKFQPVKEVIEETTEFYKADH